MSIYAIEIYDEADFKNQQSALYSLTVAELNKRKVQGYSFVQCLSFDKINFEVTYADPQNEDRSFDLEYSASSGRTHSRISRD